MQVGEMIRTAARRYGNSIALTCEGEEVSFKQFDEATDRLGNALLGMGLAPGDRVAAMMGNSIESLVVYYSLAKSGLVRVPLNLREMRSEHEYKLAYSGARVLLTSEAGGDLPCEMTVAGAALTELIANGPSIPCAVDRDYEAPLRLGFTGGTTGKPKAAVLTTRGEIAEVSGFLLDLLPNLSPADTMLHAAPISHASNAFFLPHLLRGAKQVVMPKFDADKFFEVAQRERATVTFLVPTMISMLLDHPNAAQAKLALRRLCYGAAPAAPALLERGIALFGSVFAQTYGQAESPMIITCLKPEEHHRVGSAGRPYTMVEVKIFDEDDRELPAGQPGEIVCRGQQVMSHYWERPEETAKAMRGGWLHTGDIGICDEEGYFQIVDRKNDMLISGGFNVYPREVEDMLMTVPGVAEAAVIGLPDERWGDRVQAVVSGAASLDGEAVLAMCKGKMAGYKMPKAVEVWDALPKSPAGKILRRVVRDRFIAREAKK